jgi:hypothetical protein
MTRSTTRAGRRIRAPRSIAAVAAVALAIGVAAAAVSFLGSSLVIPGPAHQASTQQLQDRGAAKFYSFCSWPKFEPHFWPECIDGADAWRARGADRLVAFCTESVPSRMFNAAECLSDDRAPLALTSPPGPQDVLVGGIAAALAFVVLALASALRRTVHPQRLQT